MTHPGDPSGNGSPPGGEPRPPDPPQPGTAARPARPVLAVVAAVTVAGVPFGLLWALLAPDVPMRVVEGGATYAESQPQQPTAADGWFAILAVAFGVLAAVGVWWRPRSIRGTPGLAALTAGAVLAALLGWWLGRQVGLSGYEASLAAAEPGALLSRPPDLRAAEASWWPPRLSGVLLVPALVAAATYTMLAAWSRYPTLRPEQSPVAILPPAQLPAPPGVSADPR